MADVAVVATAGHQNCEGKIAMFARDQQLIADMVNVGSADWLDWAGAVVVAASMTVLTDTPSVQTSVDAILRDGEAARVLNFATRGMAVRGVLDGAHIPHMLAARECVERGDLVGAQCAIMLIPGLGLPKSGFVMQMIWGVGVCIDSENEEIYGVKAPNPSKDLLPASRERHVRAYHDLVTNVCKVDSATAWDVWCGHIANKFNNCRVNKNGVSRRPVPQRDGTPWTPDAVSALHPVWVRDCYTALRRMTALRAVGAVVTPPAPRPRKRAVA